jgi:hypothetical protein
MRIPLLPLLTSLQLLLGAQPAGAQVASVIPPKLAEDDPAALFCRQLAARIRSLPKQVPVLRWEVELVRVEFKEDGTPNKEETSPPESQTVHITPNPDSNQYKIEYHPTVTRWKGTKLGRWMFEEKVQRHDGEDVLTVFTRSGTENGMSPRTTASVDKFDANEFRYLPSNAALDLLLPFLRQHHSTTPLVNSLESKNVFAKLTRLEHATRLEFKRSWSGDMSYIDEFDFPDAHPGAVSRHAAYTVSKGGKIMEMEATAEAFVELTNEWSVPQKVQRVSYREGKPWIETTYQLKAQIDPEPEQWLDLAIPGRYNVEDNIRGTQFLTPR